MGQQRKGIENILSLDSHFLKTPHILVMIFRGEISNEDHLQNTTATPVPNSP